MTDGTRETIEDWDPFSTDVEDDPFSVLNTMRSQCPVAVHHRDGRSEWSIFRYEDITAATRDTTTFGNRPPVLPLEEPRVPLEADPPEHTAYRRLLQPLFTPAHMSRIEPRVRDVAVERIVPLIEAGVADCVAALTHPLPGEVLCLLLGFPADQFAQIKVLSDDLYKAEWRTTPPDMAQVDAVNAQLFEHARRLIQRRQHDMLDPENDIVSAMIHADVESGVMAGVIRLLLTAGHNSTTNALGNTLLYLAQNPKAQDTLRSNPDRIPDAVEELLRVETPVQAMPRYVREDVELHGRQLRADDTLWLVWGAANRDPDQFEAPDRCVIDRKPNRHVAFGHGVHKCLGLPVARLELRVALEELLARTKSFRVEGDVQRVGWPRHGVASLPLRFET